MFRLGETYGNLMVDLQVSNIKLRDRAIRIIQSATNCDARRAQEALEESKDQVKVAIVIILLDNSAETTCNIIYLLSFQRKSLLDLAVAVLIAPVLFRR